MTEHLYANQFALGSFDLLAEDCLMNGADLLQVQLSGEDDDVGKARVEA